MNSSDFVKDGWQAGLWRVTTCTASFTGGTAGSVSDGVVTIGSANTTVTVDNAFSAKYQAYKIIIENESTNGTGSHLIQLNGITTSTYSGGGYFMTWGSTTITGYGPAASSSWVVSANTTANTGTVIVFDIVNPNIARRKYGFSHGIANNGHSMFNHRSTSTSTATGFNLQKAGDTMTGGTIRVYGYNL